MCCARAALDVWAASRRAPVLAPSTAASSAGSWPHRKLARRSPPFASRNVVLVAVLPPLAPPSPKPVHKYTFPSFTTAAQTGPKLTLSIGLGGPGKGTSLGTPTTVSLNPRPLSEPVTYRVWGVLLDGTQDETEEEV